MKEPKFEKISEDERGANWRILLPTGQEIVLIFTKKGAFRGGHSHSVDEISLLLSGRARYRKISPGHAEVQFTQVPGLDLYNEAGDIHLMEAIEDNWILDYKDAKAGSWTSTDYQPYRIMVEKSFKRSRS